MTREETLFFVKEIEKIRNEKDVNYMDAILLFCEERDMEIETASKLIPTSIKSKIYLEALDLNLLKKENLDILPI